MGILAFYMSTEYLNSGTHDYILSTLTHWILSLLMSVGTYLKGY